MRQPSAKNRGLDEVTTEWVYFGDDDSVLYPGSIKHLYDTCMKYKVEACGAIAYYMQPGEETMDLDSFIKKHQVYTDKVKDIVDVSTMQAKFIYSVHEPIEVPFCQACLLYHLRPSPEGEPWLQNCYVPQPSSPAVRHGRPSTGTHCSCQGQLQQGPKKQ